MNMKQKIINKPDLLKAKLRNNECSEIIYLENKVSDSLLAYFKDKKYSF